MTTLSNNYHLCIHSSSFTNILFYKINLSVIYFFNSLIVFVLLLITYRYRAQLSNYFIVVVFNITQFIDFKNYLLPIIIYTFIVNIFISLYSVNVIYNIFLLFLPFVVITFLIYFFTFFTNFFLCVSMTKNKNIITTLINDCILVFSFILRFVSQFIRIILIITVFVLLFEFISNDFNILFLNISTFFINLLRLIFELIDCFFILGVQLVTFFTVLFWLLSFLFLIKFNNIFEN